MNRRWGMDDGSNSRKRVLFENVTVKWIWGDWELMQFREMWNDGVGISDISKALKCNRKSIVLLVTDQADEGFIEQRRQ